MHDSILTMAIKHDIRHHPEAAMREIPAVLEFYLTDVARLNRVYLAAKRYCLQPDQFSRERLRQAIEEAENA